MTKCYLRKKDIVKYEIEDFQESELFIYQRELKVFGITIRKERIKKWYAGYMTIEDFRSQFEITHTIINNRVLIYPQKVTYFSTGDVFRKSFKTYEDAINDVERFTNDSWIRLNKQ